MSTTIPSFNASHDRRKFLLVLCAVCFAGFSAELLIHHLRLKYPHKDALLTGFTYGIFLFSPFIFSVKTPAERRLLAAYSIMMFFMIALSTYAIDSHRQARLLPAFFFCALYFMLLIVVRYPSLAEKFWIKKPTGFVFILYGVLLGFFLGAHLALSASLTQKYAVQFSNMSRVLYGACFSFGMNAPMEEIFYRGFAFKKLFEKGFSFWAAAAISSFLSALRFCSNPLFTSTPVALLGVFFYITLTQILFCALFRYSRSLLPSYICNAIFGSAFYLLSAI